MSSLKERYESEVIPALKKEFGYGNVMAIPKIEKIVVNMGLGEATQNAKIVDTGADEIGKITEHEQSLVDVCVGQLKGNIEKGVKFVAENP